MLHTVHQGQPVSAPALRGPERCRQVHSRHLGIGERRQSRGGSGGVPSRRSQALGGGVRLHLVVHGGRTDASRQEGDTGRACHGQRYGGPCRCGALPCRRQGCSCVHTPKHALGLPVYELTAAYIRGDGDPERVVSTVRAYEASLDRAGRLRSSPRRWAPFLIGRRGNSFILKRITIS